MDLTFQRSVQVETNKILLFHW